MSDRSSGFFARLRQAGAHAADTDEIRSQKSLLVFATGLACLAATLWPFLYVLLAIRFSITLSLLFLFLLLANLLIYLKTLNFGVFRATLFALFLLMPFVAQWGLGGYIPAGGLSLWAILAPIGALLFIGARAATPWFAAYVFLTALSGILDFYLADLAILPPVETSAQASNFFFALNFIFVSTIVFLLLRFSAADKQSAQESLNEAHQELLAERERAERLLLNILPEPIAQRLKRNDPTIADGFANVSVMFIDIVNFTRIAQGLSPQRVFSMLNQIFSSFDELTEKYGLEKIKTIGDAYMVAGGLNDKRSDYTDALVDMALEMRDYLESSFHIDQKPIEVRIGISTGPVVAGIVGKKKFIYDLWGDTVNTASRITSEGFPGIVQVDEATYLRLKERFEFYDPKSIYFKGKGKMIVYRAIGRKRVRLDIALE